MSFVVTILQRGKEEHGKLAVRLVFVGCNNVEF